MIRYELILYRRPTLSVADIPRRMADLPAEFSEGTLQRALEQPDEGAIAIAWGDNRKRLLLIKRRIEILGGSVELRDRAGPFAQKLTALNDRFLGWFRGSAADGGSKPGASSGAGLMSLGLVVAAAIAALVYAHGARDAHIRLYALRGGAFTLGLVSALVLLRGARRWYDGEGGVWLSALLVLVPTSTLMAAGYQGYKLGLVEQGAAALRSSGTASKRPLMKPFQALIVELRHRKQRAELAAVLAEQQEPAAGASAQPQPSAAEASAGDTQAPSAAHTEQGGPRGRGAGAASVKRDAAAVAPLMAARGARGRKLERAVARDDGARAWALRAATTVGACMLAATASNAAAATGASGFAAWSATRAGWGEVEPVVTTLASTAPTPMIEPPRSNGSHLAASSGVPTPSLPRSQRQHAPDERAREWEPLRSLGDVNVLHVAVALALSLLTFALGMWAGRRRAKLVTQVGGPAAVSGDTANVTRDAASPDAAHGVLLDRVETPPRDDAGVAAARESAGMTNQSAPAGQPASHEEPLSPQPIVAIGPANDARTMPDHASAAITAASAAAHKLAEAAAQKPAKARAAAAARGGIQEETVIRRRPDNRRDD